MKLLRTKLEWVAQVSLLRPGLLLANGPGRNKERSVVEGPLFLPTRNHSNLSHPSPLVIPTSGRDLQCAPRLSQILPGKRSG